jgi:uroporphyrinogen decarboxylase
VDAILISSAFAGAGLISRDDYETFVLPYERELIQGIHQDYPEVKVYTHTCGAIGDRLDLMLQTGTQGIDTLDPPPLGTVELEEACPQLKGKAFIKGNIDPVHTLLYGDQQSVRKAVEHRLEVAKPGGGYILSTACSVAPAVKPELMETMNCLTRELGRY